MKKLLISMLLVGSLFTLKAADSGTIVFADGIPSHSTNFLTGGALVTSIVIYNGSGLQNTYAIIDSPNTNTTHNPLSGATLWHASNGAYTAKISYTTNIITIITNSFGLTNHHWLSNVTYTVDNAVISRTNDYRVLQTGTIASSNTVTITPTGGWAFGNGVTITNSIGTNVSTFKIIYTPFL